MINELRYGPDIASMVDRGKGKVRTATRVSCVVLVGCLSTSLRQSCIYRGIRYPETSYFTSLPPLLSLPLHLAYLNQQTPSLFGHDSGPRGGLPSNPVARGHG